MTIDSNYKKHIRAAMKLWVRANYADNFLPGQSPGHIAYYIQKLVRGMKAYKQASVLTGIPWQIIGVLHGLEGQFDFSRQVFNGEKWNQKTTIVPKNKGPWESWLESTEDALRDTDTISTWGVMDTAHFFESWNGMGYYNKGIYTPYLWSYLAPYAQQGGGKYVSDGKFDRNAVSKQVGAITQLLHSGYFWK